MRRAAHSLCKQGRNARSLSQQAEAVAPALVRHESSTGANTLLSSAQETEQRWYQSPKLRVLGMACGVVLGTSYVLNERSSPLWSDEAAQNSCMGVKWVQDLAEVHGNELVLSAATLHSHPLLKKDHMFSNLYEHQMVQDMVCFYSPSEQKLQYVIRLGRNVCGFPSIMHGGLTAAIVDECFGFLWLSLRANKQLPFHGIALTAHLEVDYKKKIPAGRLLLCSTEVESCEGRKLWMRATVKDGPTGQVYATARALFVRPRTQKLLQEGIKIAYSYLRAE